MATDLNALARESLLVYCMRQYPKYDPAPHIRRLTAVLEAVERGEKKRVMVFMPPRHSKSMTTSEFFPAWYLGRNPDKYIITATYVSDLAEDFGRKVRNQILDPEYRKIFPGCQLAKDSQSAGKFNTASGGSYFAVGVGSAITGRGAHCLLVDDPLKGREEAESETTRQKIKDWYQSTAYTRLMPGGAVIILMTRWHQDDLAGWLLREHADENWEVISLPACDEDMTTALWPAAYPIERLREIRRAIGPREWSALYMQTPMPDGGGYFKREWLRHYKNVDNGRGMNRYITVDPAGSKGKKSDFTAIIVWGLGADGNYYVLDMVRDRLSLTERTARVMELHRKWKPKRVGYEKYSMQGDIEHLKDLQEKDNYRFDVVALGGNMKKELRVERLVPLFEQGRVYLPETLHRADYNGKMVDLIDRFIEEEYVSFPAGLHDDILDCMARILDEGMDAKHPKEGQVTDEGRQRQVESHYRHDMGMWMV